MDDRALQGQSNWVPIVEGIALLLLGFLVIAWPGMSFAALVFAFGLYALVAGIVQGISGIIHIGRGWSAIGQMVLGLLLVGVGAYTLNHPGVAAATLAIIIGLTFLARGIFDIVVAFESPVHRALGITAGIFGILAGLIILRYPIGGGIAYVWLLGVYALVAGPMMIAKGVSTPTTTARY